MWMPPKIIVSGGFKKKTILKKDSSILPTKPCYQVACLGTFHFCRLAFGQKYKLSHTLVFHKRLVLYMSHDWKSALTSAYKFSLK